MGHHPGHDVADRLRHRLWKSRRAKRRRRLDGGDDAAIPTRRLAREQGVEQEAEERTLLKAIREASATAVPCFKANDYTGYLQAFAVLKDPVDAFFEKVMVMVEDAAVRRNRLALLADLHREMNQVADLSRLSI